MDPYRSPGRLPSPADAPPVPRPRKLREGDVVRVLPAAHDLERCAVRPHQGEIGAVWFVEGNVIAVGFGLSSIGFYFASELQRL